MVVDLAERRRAEQERVRAVEATGVDYPGAIPDEVKAQMYPTAGSLRAWDRADMARLTKPV